MLGPLTSSIPGWPGSTRQPVSRSTMHHVTDSSGFPMVPVRGSSSRLTETTGEHSVMP